MSRDGTMPTLNGRAGGATARTAPKLEKLLAAAAGLMAARGFTETSIRDVAGETGFSLGGMYYYFRNKEDLLFLIQSNTFGSLLALQEESLAAGGTPAERLRRLVHNHLAWFVSHFNELKVCTFELQSLQGEHYDSVAALRRRYFACVAGVVRELTGDDDEARVRHRTLFVFGMLNWIFMWYDAERDQPVERLGDEMVDLVLGGLGGAAPKER
jgi:TetR/AcrR family transcriptional regulator